MTLIKWLYRDRFCPLVERELPADICRKIAMCFSAGLSIASVPEVSIEKNKDTKRICDNCPYSYHF